MALRLTAADAAWLSVDRPTNPMVVTAVLRLSPAVGVDDVRDVVASRLVGRYPRFGQRVVRSRVPGVAPSWVGDTTFDLTRHVVEESPVPDGELPALVGRLMSRPLDLASPPWQLHVVRIGGASAIIARLHHCIADGIALAQVLLGLTDATSEAPEPLPRRAAAPRPRPTAVAVATGLVGTTAKLLTAPLVASRREPPTSLRRTPTGTKRVGWSRPHDLASVKRAAKRAGVSVNDVLLAAVAGGLRTLLLQRDETPVDVRVMVPVDLRGAAPDASLGNRLGVVFVTLPVGVADPLDRLRLVAERTSALKGSAQPAATFGMLRLVGALPAVTGSLAAWALGAAATAVVTNVPGPREPLRLAGSQLESVVFWAPQAGGTALGLSVFSYAGTVTVGAVSDAALDLDPSDLAAAVDDELGRLSDAG